MTIFDLYVSCDNIMPGACFMCFTKSSDYINKNVVNCYMVRSFNDMEQEEQLFEVSAFEVAADGYTVYVRLAV